MRATTTTRNTRVVVIVTEMIEAEMADMMSSRVVIVEIAGRKADTGARMRAMDARSVMATKSADLSATARQIG